MRFSLSTQFISLSDLWLSYVAFSARGHRNVLSFSALCLLLGGYVGTQCEDDSDDWCRHGDENDE